MKIIVLIKQVPDTTDVKLDPKTGNLIREGLESIINPDDRHALEGALQLKAETQGRVTVLSMGPPQAVDAVSEALGMGADAGILLSDSAFAGADTWATSFTLGKAVAKLGEFDLIFCGRQAIDGDTAQIGPQVAEFLGVPQVSYVCGLEAAEPGQIIVKRRLEDGFERIRCSLPALLTVTAELNRPRYPELGRLIGACVSDAPIEIWNAADIGVETREIGQEGSLTQVIKTFSPKFKRQAEILEGEPPEVVKALFGRLSEVHLPVPGVGLK